jgi:branched-subunit amino acid aminotransferase/4-amino-4-deoxychorismate lyase
MKIFVNGAIVEADQAKLSVEDSGLQHAVGLFETMAAFNGKVFQIKEHLQRLSDSARVLGLAKQVDVDALVEPIQQTLAANNLLHARIRLTLTAGTVSMLRGSDGAPPRPSIVIVATEPTKYDPAYFEQGIRVLVGTPLANPFDMLAGHKTLSYWGRLRLLRQAAAAGAGEALVLNVTNHLASGTVSNIFLVKDDVLFTPFARGEEVEGALPAPVLPGITRATVIDLATQFNIAIERRMLSVDDLLDADEVFLTNSSWQVLPVTSVEKQNISDGKVGPMTEQLRDALLEQIESDTAVSE